MKKILLSCLTLAFVGCSSNTYETKTQVSDFDGTVYKKSTPAIVSCNEWGGEFCPYLTYSWSNKSSENIRVTAGVRTSLNYFNFTKIAFNIDGQIYEYDNYGLNNHKYLSSINMKESEADFIMPKSVYNQFSTAKIIKLKLTTMSDGAIERTILDNGVESKAYKAIKAFNP